MRTHVDLLISMAKKMNALVEDRHTIAPSMMEEFSYPLERARDFVRIVSSRYAERQSLRAFTDFLDTYAELVREVDRLRVLRSNEKPMDLSQRIEALQEQGARVKAILAEEERTG